MHAALRTHIELFYTDHSHEPCSMITMSISISAAGTVLTKCNLHTYFNLVQAPFIILFLVLHKSLSGVKISVLLSSMENL